MCEAARQHALAKQWHVTIVVVDDGGHPGLHRLDGCAPASAYIAMEKARTSALGRKETRDYEDMINRGRTAFVTAPLLTCLEGGVPQVQGQVVGAIGVSGSSPTRTLKWPRRAQQRCERCAEGCHSGRLRIPLQNVRTRLTCRLSVEKTRSAQHDQPGKRRMHPYARSIAELRSSLREMLAHDISNPDDDPHLSG